MNAIQVSLLEPGEETSWDGFVEEFPSATFFHRSGWKPVIEKAFGHRTFYIMARLHGQIAGILPLTLVRSRLFGTSLISNAFCVHGGPLAECANVRDLLAGEAHRLARSLKAGGVEFRSSGNSAAGWEARTGIYANFRRDMSDNVEANLKAVPRKQRAMIRKGIANGLTSVVDDDVDRLHHIYAQSVRNLGTPVFPRRYFRLLKQQFGNACDVITVVAGERPIASVLNFYFRKEVLPYYGGGTPDARHLAGNDFMYWEVMRRACERGFQVFDFGRSKVGTGACDFKRNWGFEPTPLTYEYLALGQRKMGEVNPLNPKYRIAINLWKRLPLPVTKLVGPVIVRSIG